MSQFLAIDIGNTRTKYALFRNGAIEERWQHSTGEPAEVFCRYINKAACPVSLASVVPAAGDKVRSACNQLALPLFEISAAAQQILQDMNPGMGADRVCDAVGAYHHYRQEGTDLAVMSFGTASTLLHVRNSKAGKVGKGLIAPGVGLLLEVLHCRCALLPDLNMEGAAPSLADTTESQIRNGILLAVIGQVKEWLAVTRKEAGKEILAVATGGWASLLKESGAPIDVVDRDLTFRGIAAMTANPLAGQAKEQE